MKLSDIPKIDISPENPSARAKGVVSHSRKIGNKRTGKRNVTYSIALRDNIIV